MNVEVNFLNHLQKWLHYVLNVPISFMAIQIVPMFSKMEDVYIAIGMENKVNI